MEYFETIARRSGSRLPPDAPGDGSAGSVASIRREELAIRRVDRSADRFVVGPQRRQNFADGPLVVERQGRHAVPPDDLRLRHQVVAHARAERPSSRTRGSRRTPASSASELVSIVMSISFRLIDRFRNVMGIVLSESPVLGRGRFSPR